MKKIKGIRLAHFPLPDLKIAADLIYLDGPILSLFKNKNGDDYLYCWSDMDEDYNRWLIFHVSHQQLNLYLKRKLSFRDLILNPVDGFLYSVDIDDDIQHHNVHIVQPAELPEAYLPEPDSYYDFEPLFFEDEETPSQPKDQQMSINGTARWQKSYELAAT